LPVLGLWLLLEIRHKQFYGLQPVFTLAAGCRVVAVSRYRTLLPW